MLDSLPDPNRSESSGSDRNDVRPKRSKKIRDAATSRGAIALLSILLWAVAQTAVAAGCPWDASAFAFQGNAKEQARCLLRPVAKGGVVADAPAALPIPLLAMIEAPVKIAPIRLRHYLSLQRIDESSIGGAVDTPLSLTEGPTVRFARYFVIHDTSWILCQREDFPANADAPDAQWNRAETWSNYEQAHLFITRDGASYAPQQRTFATPWRAVKFEKQLGIPSRGLFLHIENVQLRRPEAAMEEPLTDANGECVNDRIAQSPGFSKPQTQRLALVYIAASVRAGRWMIPAFHAVLDTGIPGGHDDPQNFDIKAWTDEVCALRSELGDPCMGTGLPRPWRSDPRQQQRARSPFKR